MPPGRAGPARDAPRGSPRLTRAVAHQLVTAPGMAGLRHDARVVAATGQHEAVAGIGQPLHLEGRAPGRDVVFHRAHREFAQPHALLNQGACWPPRCLGETPARLDATFYGGWIDYQGTQVKDTARLWGLSTWLGLGKSHAIETAFDYIEVDRVGLPRLKQRARAFRS